MKKLIIGQFKKTSAIGSGISLVFGFISDFLNPIAPLSSYLFFAAAFSMVFILITMWVKKSVQEKIAPALVVSIGLMIVSGALFGLQAKADKKSGVLASQIPVLKTLQSSLGLIQEDVAAIRKSTDKIDKTTARTEEMVKQVAKETKKTTAATEKVAEAVQDSTEKIVGSLAEIQKGFTALTQSGGVIANPTRPEQFYHNARIQEQGGDYGNARKSYNLYFSFKLEFLDPHLRYQTFLKIQEGRAGAREIYSAIYENDPRPVVEFARILLFIAPKRTEMLKKFIAKNPDFAPAYYELSREFSEIRKGTQSLSDKKEELNALQKFETLRNEGKFLRYFVDKELASKWVADTEKRLSALSIIAETASAPPVSIFGLPTNQGWMLTIQILEKAREIFYRWGNENDFKSTGLLKFKDPTTGLPMPMLNFNIPLKKERTKIFIKYFDISKKEKGPFEFEFDARKEHINFAKSDIYNPPNNWISFGKRLIKGKALIYLPIMSKRCGVAEIRYGIGTTPPNQTLKLRDCDITNPHKRFRDGKDDAVTNWKVPPSTTSVSIQLVYRDGTVSGVRNFQK